MLVKSRFQFQIFYIKFDCINTLNDQLLEKVTVRMETSDGYEVISYKTCNKLAYNAPGVSYSLVRIPEDPTQGKCFKFIIFYKLKSFNVSFNSHCYI